MPFSSPKDEASSSPYRRYRSDEECGRSHGSDNRSDDDVDTFDIPPKKAPPERLRKWRQATLVLNASRRFRYTLDLKKQEEREQTRRKIRAHAQVIRAAFLFKEAGEKLAPGAPGGFPVIPTGGYGIAQKKLTAITRDHDFPALQQLGGLRGIADLLNTNLEKGISGADSELDHRRHVFGENNYPRKKGRSFWIFLWEAWQDLTLIILIVAAAASLALGIKTEGIKEGWYDGGSIAFAVVLVIVVTGTKLFNNKDTIISLMCMVLPFIRLSIARNKLKYFEEWQNTILMLALKFFGLHLMPIHCYSFTNCIVVSSVAI